MYRFLLLFLLVYSSSGFAQLDLTSQSSSNIKWKSVSNAWVRVLYPDYLETNESNYIPNLIEHYSQFVGQTYGIQKPEKFTLILRPEMAEPNGFVTLGPRRSEWYGTSTYFPLIGGAEWYQALATHEYRHVQQFDHFNQSTSKVLWYLLGDTGRFLAVFLGLQPWYMEGDAVWSETKYTDSGRGRSPRFLARMKALILSEKIPSYEEFVNQSYRTQLPNHYYWGYILISNATNKYGEDFWAKVTEKTAKFPHPWRLYSSFEAVSGESFKDFYDETMAEMREQWKDDVQDPKWVEYRENSYPFKINDSLYFLNRDLDTFHKIMKRSDKGDIKIADIPFINEVSQIHVAQDKAVYAQLLPDERYGFKESSDLILIDLSNGTKNQITDDLRIYNPRLNHSATKIIATHFTDRHKWNLVEYDLHGKLINEINFPDYKVSEAAYLDDNTAYVLTQNLEGEKVITKVNLSTKEMTSILGPTRNIIFALNTDRNNNLFFEAQYKGKNEIFKISPTHKLAKCTNTKIASYSPSSDGQTITYSDMDTNGTVLKQMPVSGCTSIETTQLMNYNYLGTGPSDNLNNFPPMKLQNHAALYTTSPKDEKEHYHNVDQRLFVPHSWTFSGGRGLALGFQADNFLRSADFGALIGSSAEENASYTTLNFNYKQYYPILNFHFDYRHRDVNYYDTNNEQEWKEKDLGMNVILPYTKKKDLFTFQSLLNLGASYRTASDYDFNETSTDVRDQNFHMSSASLTLNYQKDTVTRSIYAPYDYEYFIQADKANNVSDNSFDSYRIYQEAKVQLPGFFNHNSFWIKGAQEKQDPSSGAYRFLPYAADPTTYVFSRGYAYESVAEYRKVSANYTFPIAYPDSYVRGFYYLRRLYGNLFFDNTYIKDPVTTPTLNSFGAELLFESKFFRILPLTFGTRLSYKEKDRETVFDFFATTNLTTF